MSLLDRRNTSAGIIEQRFITATLNKTGKDILADSKREQKGFTNAKWNHVSANASDNTLTYEHLPRHRFVDMKVRKVGGKRKPKKNHEIHNRIIMGQFAGIQGELTYGLTEQVKEQIKKEIGNLKI